MRLFESRQPLHVLLRVGTVMSVLGTATGRAFAAALPPERLERAIAISHGVETGSQAAPPRGWRKELEAAVEEVRRHGLARAIGRPIPGVNAFSGAAFDHEGQAAVVITVLDHEDRLKGDWNGDGARAVREATDAITRRLGGRPPAARR